MNVIRVSKEEWAEKFYFNAHFSVFKEPMEAGVERIDFAQLVETHEENLVMYATICEPKKGTAYINYGGSFPAFRGSITSLKAFKKILSDLFETHNEVTFHCENTNFAMLKLAISTGFKIIGVTYTRSGKILVEHLLERDRYNRQGD